MVIAATASAACSASGRQQAPDTGAQRDSNEPVGTSADVVAVAVSGTSEQYSFSVTLSSPDTGCEQYADWWEVLDPSGALIYRRILAHSHVGEQPFTRSGGPVAITGDREVLVRAHMNTTGYGGVVWRGTADTRFELDSSIDSEFAAEIATAQPLPDGCAF